MAIRPTLADLAKTAGVSPATVDRVINRRLPVSEHTARLVVQAAEDIGFHATSLLKRRLHETPQRRFGFLLQKRQDAFYQNFAAELVKATASAAEISGKAIVDFSEELVPKTIVGRLEALAERSDAVAVVAMDHPHVSEAIERIAARGKPVFTLLSDVSTPARKAYLAVDSRKAGRTAAWVISRTAPHPGKVGILVGSHRYLSQEMSEISFRSYMREHAKDLQLLEPIINLDDARIAYEAVIDMLSANPDLVAIYDSGGGQDGLIQALRDEGAGSRIVTVCNELTSMTKSALIDGTVDLVLATPIAALTAKLLSYMIMATEGGRNVPEQTLIPAELFISENI
jgi:LacI family transcriptional regulator